MEPTLDKYIRANQAEYGPSYARMRFATSAEAADFNRRRAELLAALDAHPAAKTASSNTKYYCGELSPGCAACGAGHWSCLFVNGICNGTCFYCPTPQDDKGEPMTNNLRFPVLQDYLDYVALFHFSGVSLSGGEPLLTFERTLEHVRTLKETFGDSIHLWLYSNGMLATPEKIARLADAGLDEMRFDISADHYRLDHLQLAVNRIPRITVEIPAIPEDLELMLGKLAELADVGVKHLNLHQLRCTPHNLEKLLARNYIFSHGPKVLVPESEITALHLLLAACESGGPSVNYCSFAYKSRFQGRAARMRAASILAAPHEDVTEAGYIGSLSVKGDESAINTLLTAFETKGVNPLQRKVEKKTRVYFNRTLWPLIDFNGLELQVKYFAPQIRENVSYQGSHQKIPLNKQRSIVAERISTGAAKILSEAERIIFAKKFLHGTKSDSTPQATPAPPALRDITAYEQILPGLDDINGTN